MSTVSLHQMPVFLHYQQRLEHKEGIFTSMSKQAALSKVIWSAMVRVVKPGSRLANSTILMMHLVESSLNLSHSPRSS